MQITNNKLWGTMNMKILASNQLVLWNMLELYNLNPADIFRKVRMDPGLMRQPGARYTSQNIDELWEEVNRRIKDPCFGFAAATCWHPSYYGLLGYAMLASNSLRTSLERLVRFHEVVSQASYGELHEESEKGTLVFTWTHKGITTSTFPPIREDAALVRLMSMLRMNFQRPLFPVSVSITHSRPVCEAKYHEFFQSSVTFDSPKCSLELSLDVVDIVLPTENKELTEFSDQAMARYIAAMNQENLVSRVKKIIAEHLPSGTVTVETVASDLYISTRKLQRLLQEKGLTFTLLLNETRKNIAEQYVEDRNMDLVEISFLLGYSDQTTFSRAFKVWTGKSPMQYRKAV